MKIVTITPDDVLSELSNTSYYKGQHVVFQFKYDMVNVLLIKKALAVLDLPYRDHMIDNMDMETPLEVQLHSVDLEHFKKDLPNTYKEHKEFVKENTI